MIENYKQIRKNTLSLNQDDYTYREVYESQYFLGIISLIDEILEEKDIPKRISKPYPLFIDFEKRYYRPKLTYMDQELKEGNLIEMIESIFQGKDKISLGAIVDMILDLYSQNIPLTDNDKMPSKSNLLANYNKLLGILGGKELFKTSKGLFYPKRYVPVVIFLLIMCSSKNNAFNMIINNKTREKISYRSIVITMNLFQKFLMKYSMFEKGKNERMRILEAFYELFDYKSAQTFLKIKNRIEHLFNQLDEVHDKISLTEEELEENQKYFEDIELTTNNEKEAYLENFEKNILYKIDDFHNEISRVLWTMKDRNSVELNDKTLETFYFLKSV